MKKVLSYRIRERRLAAGLKQDELARLVNISQAQVSKYERGENEPDSQSLVQLAHILHTTTDYLLGVTNEVNPSYKDSDLSEKEKVLLNLFRSKSPENQEKMLNVAKVI